MAGFTSASGLPMSPTGKSACLALFLSIPILKNIPVSF
jgi:hypothetical protein